MSNTLSRRLLLRGLPMAPAMAKQAVGEIVKQAVATTSAALDGGAIRQMAGRGSTLGNGGWESAYKYVMDQVRAGKVPEHKRREYVRHAHYRARLAEDHNVEALGSISAGHRHRMHIESAYDRIIKEEIEAEEGNTMFAAILKKFEGQP